MTRKRRPPPLIRRTVIQRIGWCDSYGRSQWPPRKVVCVGAVVLQGGSVLLIRQAKGASLEGQWSIPWGIVEPNESPEEAALRETYEEAGVTAEVEGLLGIQNLQWESSIGRYARNGAKYEIPVPQSVRPLCESSVTRCRDCGSGGC